MICLIDFSYPFKLFADIVSPVCVVVAYTVHTEAVGDTVFVDGLFVVHMEVYAVSRRIFRWEIRPAPCHFFFVADGVDYAVYPYAVMLNIPLI